jgi:two-component system sensor kinase FixL
MKIGQKLTLAYLGIAIVATTIVFVAFASFRNITTAFEQLERDPVPTAKALEDLRKETVQIITSASKISFIYSEAANGTKFETQDITKEQAELDEAEANFDKALTHYENLAMVSDHNNTQLFNNIELHGARIKNLSEQFVLLKKYGGKGQAVLDLREVFQREEAAFLEATDTALTAEYAQMQNGQQNVVATIASSQRTSGVVTLFVFAFATLSGLFISRSISKRLSSLKDAAEKIGSGHFDTRVEIKSKDELGDLGKAFNNMVRDLRITSSNLDVATTRLQESEERWQLALHVNDDGIWDWDIANSRCFYSPRWRRMFGYDDDEEIEESPANVAEFFHPEDRPLALALRDQLRRGELPYFDVEFRHHCKDDSYKWVRCRGQAIFNPETGRVDRVIGLDTDIELKKRAELEREAIRTILQGVSETSNLDELLVLIHQSIGKVIYAENCFVALYDKSSHLFKMEFFVDKFDEPCPPTDLTGTRTHYVFRTGEPLLLDDERTDQLERQGEFRLVGSPPKFWLGTPLKTPSEVIGVLVVQSYDEEHSYTQRDLEFLRAVAAQVALAIDRKRTENRLEAQSRRLNDILENTPCVIWESPLDAASAQTGFVNAYIEQMYGYTQEEWLSTPDFWSLAIHPEDRETMLLDHETIFRDGHGSNVSRWITKDGRTIWGGTRIVVVYDESGTPIGLRGVTTDITELRKAEIEIQEARDYLDRIINAIADPIFVNDRTHRMVLVNDAFLHFTHRKREEVIGKSSSDLCRPEEARVFREMDDAVFESEKDTTNEEEFTDREGNHKVMLTRKTIWTAKDGQKYLVGIIRDITERKHAEEAIRNSEERHRLLFERSPMPMWVYDHETLAFLAVNRAAISHYGYSQEEFLTMTLREIRPAEDVEALLHDDTKDTRELHHGGRWRHCKKDGTIIDVEITAHPLGFEGRSASIVLVNDITERKAAEEALQESEARFRDLFDHAPVAYHELDSGGRILRINHTEELLLGYTNEELKGRHVSELVLESASREAVTAKLEGRQQLVPVERTMIRKDGTHVPVLNEDRLIYDSSGNIAGIRSTLQDITALKEAEQQLKIFNDKLQQSNRELQDFAYVASHDLQEPLRKVQTFGDRLASKYGGALEGSGLDYLERMRSAANRMQILIQDLLSFSRVTTKAQPFVPVNLEQITREVLSDLEVKIEETGAIVETHDLPTLDADPLQMRQLIQNLVGNALKFRRADTVPVIKVSATNGQMNGHGLMYAITIEDNGIGFDEKYLDKIFTVFQRLHGRAEYEGSGIGLAVCRKIVERHNGSITARSAPGEGAKFIFTLPCHQANAEVN